MTRRRNLLVLAGAACIGVPGISQGLKHRIAYLGATSLPASRHLVSALVSGLRDLGYIEGVNFDLSLSFAEGDAGKLESLTREILARAPDVLVVSTDTTARHAASLTKTVPIVFVLDSTQWPLAWLTP